MPSSTTTRPQRTLTMTVFSLAANARAHHVVRRSGHLVHVAAGVCSSAVHWRSSAALCTLCCDLGTNKTNKSPPSHFYRPVFVPSRDMTEVMISSAPMEDMRLSPSKDRLAFQVGCTKTATSCVILFMLTLTCVAINNKQTG